MRHAFNLNLLLLLSMFLAGCGLFSVPPSPTATPPLLFVTPTPAGAAANLPSPTITAPTAIPSLTLTPPPTPSPTATPLAATFTPTSIPRPQAVINGPQGSVTVRGGPGLNYISLGVYNNGAVVEVLGKQQAADGSLWWLIIFPPGPDGRGWLYTEHTISQNVNNVPWVTAPATPTPAVTATPTSPPWPQAVINSPNGFLYIRSGPGLVYDPPLGSYSNGVVVNIIGQQLDTQGDLWWLISLLNMSAGQGWIYANYTIPRNVGNVPWSPAPPLPATPTPTRTPTPSLPPLVSWTITGRVIKAGTNQPVTGASVRAILGNDGTTRTTLTDSNGYFSITASAHDDGNLSLLVSMSGYVNQNFTAGAVKPRLYNFPAIELTPQQPASVTWVIVGRVVEIGVIRPISNALVAATLGADAVRLQTQSGTNGEFALNGQARDSGNLTLTITAAGYQPFTLISPQTASRVYNLADLSLVPLADSCAYESVINLPQTSALARLQSLNFTQVATTPVSIGGNPGLLDRVVNQSPDPPPEGESKRLNCQVSIILSVGIGQ